MKALVIGANSVRRLFRDRSNIFFVFIFPIALILIIGASFGGAGLPVLGAANLDQGELGEELVERFRADPRWEVNSFDTQEELLVEVERGNLTAGVVVPADYTSALFSGDRTEVGFITTPGGLPQMQAVVAAEVADQSLPIAAAEFAVSRSGVSFEEALSTARNVKARTPGIEVQVRTQGETLFPDTLGRFDLGASSQLLLFVFLTTLTGSAALIESRRLGISKRMLSTPTALTTVVTGEGLGRFGIALVQGLYIVLASLVIFGVNWGDPLGAAAILVAFSLAGAGAGMLMGAMFRNDQQAAGLGILFGLGMAALGGSMLPLELFSPTMQTVAHFTPHAWANDAFAELVRRGGTVTDILPQLGVLAAYGIVLLLLAGWRLRAVLTRE
jgi:ABC-2 type transport system permease protein